MPQVGSVLVIDDDDDFRHVLCDEIAHAGYEVEDTGDGHDGVDRLRKSDVDVIIVDVQMPGLNGHEVIRAARSQGAKSEVVVITAFPKLETAIECIQAGVFAFLEKPFAPDALLATLEHAVERRRLQSIEALYRGSRELFSSADPERKPQIIVETAMQVLDADDASLMLPDGSGGLIMAYSHGLPDDVRAAVRVEIGKGVAGVVAADRKPALLVGGLGADPRFANLRGLGRVRSSIVHPLASGERLVGVLNVNRVHSPKPFRPADLELAGVFASQALLALDNVMLVRRLIHAERLGFLGRLTAEISHEISNPCTYVISNLEYVVETLAAKSAGTEVLSSAREGLEGARRIAKVVSDMKALMRGEELTSDVIDLNVVVRAALQMTAPELVKVRVSTDLGTGTWVRGNVGRLRQVFVNLLTNACHAVQGRPDAHIEVSTELRGNRVTAVVTDNGVGIPVKDQGRIFEAFFTTKGETVGTGLGLSISREIVQRHGGELVVKSSQGAGSRFCVLLPSAVVEDADARVG